MFKYLVFITSLFFSNFSFSWNAAGHHLISAITWDLLSTDQQNYWVDILKHHPRFEQDFKTQIPQQVKRNPELYKEWIFRQASTWPDIARGIHASQRDKYHHGSWHYINHPLYLDKKVSIKSVNRNIKWKGAFHNRLNSIQALKGNLAMLSKSGVSKREKALALSWVLHLVGDAHQPLHSTALFSKKYFKKGDRGGNSIKISGQGRVNNLHWYWDSRLDWTTSFKIIDIKAKKLNVKYRNSSVTKQRDSIKQWTKDAHKIAKKYVYTPQLLVSLKNSEKNREPQPRIFISNDYDVQAREKSEKQITDASYQLAYILKKL